MLNVRKVTHRDTYFLTRDSGDEVETMFQPVDWMTMHAEQVGDHLVIAYLVQDESPENPMTSSDCQGHIYTKPRRYGGGGGFITDDMSEFCSALHVSSDGEIDRDETIFLNGANQSLAEHAADEFLREEGGHELTDDWLAAMAMEFEHDDDDRSIGHHDEIHADLVNGDFKDEEIDKIILRLFMENWRAIVGPFVVPISFHQERGSTSIGVTRWDGDPDDLPDGVWVADKDAEDNIKCSPLPANVHVKYSYREKCWRVMHEVPGGVNVKFDDHTEAFKFAHTLGTGSVAWQAERYADSILEEYGNWCDGNVFGCVVETFKHNVDEGWERIEDDACWGFIGSDYAEDTLLTEYFNPAVADAKAKEAA